MIINKYLNITLIISFTLKTNCPNAYGQRIINNNAMVTVAMVIYMLLLW